MKRIIISLCLIASCHLAIAQRTYQFISNDKLFLEGKEFYDLKNYAGAVDKLEAFKLQSTNTELIQEADYMLVSIAFEQGKEDVTERLLEYNDSHPDSPHTDDLLYMIGATYFADGDYGKAILWMNQANPDRLSEERQEAFAYHTAYSLLQTGETEKARGYFAQIRKIGTKYSEPAGYYMAYIDYTKGKYNDALTEFTRLKGSPDYREMSMHYITQIYFAQSKYDRAIKEGEELLSTWPNSENATEIKRVVGHSYYLMQNESKAIEYLSQYAANAEMPLRSDMYILGVSYFNQKNYRGAINAFSKTVDPIDALAQNAYLYLGQCYLAVNDKNNARMAFEAAATSSFDQQVKEAALYNYALLIHETSFTGFGESVTIFEDFLNSFSNSQYSDQVNDYLVEVYLTTKNYQSALASIEKIRRPSNKILEAKQNILFHLGTEAFTNTKIPEANNYFTQAIDLGNYNLDARNDAYFWRGECYYRSANYAQAINDFRTYINNSRQHNSQTYLLAHYNLGYCYFKLKRFQEAMTSFNTYINAESNREAPSYADAMNRVGDCLYNNRQFAQAEEYYSRAASVRPASADYALYQKGFIQGLQKDYTSKISTMDQMINSYPESQYVDDALYEKGRAYVLLGNSNNAIATFDQLMTRFPQSSLSRKAGVQIGLLHFNNNEMDKAAEAYKKVIRNYPGSEEAQVSLQDLRSVYVEMNNVSAYADYVNSLGGNVRVAVSEQDSLTYIAAEKLFMRGDHVGARQSLINYLQAYPEGAFSSNANFYLASIAYNQKDYPEALQRYAAVLNSGDIKFREEALARKAEVEYVTKDYNNAYETFRQLAVAAEKPEYLEAAKLGQMRSAWYARKAQESWQSANELLKDTKLSPDVKAEAQYIRAKAAIGLNQPQNALPDLTDLSKDTRTAYGAEAKFLLAQYYFNNKETDKAEKELLDFMEKGTPHQYWMARSFILLADVYISKNDNFQARQYLTSLQNNYKGNAEIDEMIKQRLEKLN